MAATHVMRSETERRAYDAARERWAADCLAEYNARYGSSRTLHQYSPAMIRDDYDPDCLVEFADNGDAYPHSTMGGTGHASKAVTPWERSRHYRP